MQQIKLIQEQLDFQSREAYSTLRTNIEFSGENIKVICLTSCMPNEGKSSVSYELARSYAMNGKKTLLIDADLRKSVMSTKVTGGKAKYGLSTLLIGKVSAEEGTCSTDIPNMDVILAGPIPPNPSELLDAQKFAELIEKSREIYDMIIIDSPPLGSVIDSAIIAKQCDGTILLIASGVISQRLARKVKEQLTVTGCKVLGCVLNRVDMSGKKYYGKYFGKHYNRYYGNYEKE